MLDFKTSRTVKDGNFGWRALRLLALQFSHFFTHNNNQINKLPEYLESMIRKIAKERPIVSIQFLVCQLVCSMRCDQKVPNLVLTKQNSIKN